MGVVIPERDSMGNPVQHVDAFPVSDKWRFAGFGRKFVATKTATTNHYHKIGSKQAFNGLSIKLRNQVFGDTMDLLIESDGTLNLGAGPIPIGTVLNQFGVAWNTDWERAYQDQIVLPYRGTLVPGMRINIRYHSVGTVDDVDVLVNYFLHDEL